MNVCKSNLIGSWVRNFVDFWLFELRMSAHMVLACRNVLVAWGALLNSMHDRSYCPNLGWLRKLVVLVGQIIRSNAVKFLSCISRHLNLLHARVDSLLQPHIFLNLVISEFRVACGDAPKRHWVDWVLGLFLMVNVAVSILPVRIVPFVFSDA